MIELMISLTLGLLLLATLTSLFLGQSRARAELDRANRLIENGRYAMEVLSDDVRLAGYYGELDPSSVALPGAAPDPCATAAADIALALRLHIQGYDDATAGSKPTCVPAVVSGTDVLVVRRVATIASPAPTAATAAPYLQVSLCQHDVTPYKVDKDDFDLHQKDCTSSTTGTLATVRRFLVHIYFIAPENSAGDGIPTLKRAELAADGSFTTTALVEGVQNMQIDYGIDTNNDGAVDNYSDCSGCTLAQWANVVGARISLLARNQESTAGYADAKTYTLGGAGTVGPFNDGFKRRVYSEFVRLANPAGRKETS